MEKKKVQVCLDKFLVDALDDYAKTYSVNRTSALSVIISRSLCETGHICCKNCYHSYEDLSGLVCSFGVCVDCVVPEDFSCSNGRPKLELPVNRGGF